jgi:D-alanyl-D-alanine carboxypeptidase/D-alanyl-D-alanine-endopeptidase (penicillin-binding protein 4)
MIARLSILLTCFIVLLFPASKGTPDDLPAALDAAIAGSKLFSSAYLGIQVVRLSDGKVLYERNQDRVFVPASNTKLFASALALTRLGGNYRFTTSIAAEQPVDEQGTLPGDLIFIGRGDPTLSRRPYPYSKDWTDDGRVRPIEDLADQLVAGGLKSVRGDIVGDDTRYPFTPFPGGWNIDDGVWEYGSPVSALTVADSRLDVLITPGDAVGDLAHVSVSPQLEFLTIDNRVRTTAGGPRKVMADGRPGSFELQFWGTIPLGSKGDLNALAAPDPAVFAAALLRDALIRRGVEVRGQAVARHRFLDDVTDPLLSEAAAPVVGTELARRVSPPLIQILQVMDKVSQNLHAEIMLRETAAVRRNMGSEAAGVAELNGFVSQIGIAGDQCRFVDGSGLSRSTLVSPQAVTKLLAYMYGTRGAEWVSLLPVGGVDGTLTNRFKGHPEARAIHAKTGSLGHVRALGGYVESRRHGMLAFSVMLNNYLAPDAEAGKFLDTIGLKLIP